MKHYQKRIKEYLKSLCLIFQRKEGITIPVLQNELLLNRCALITGGTSGIGWQIAKAFLSSGASVVLTSRTQARADLACEELKAFLHKEQFIFGVAMDNCDINNLDMKFAEIISRLDGCVLDILVNNAGVSQGEFGLVDESAYDHNLDTNLKAPYFLSQCFARYIKHLRESDFPNLESNILNISSSSSIRPAHTPYAISKWGVRGMTLGLAKTLLPYGVVVNGIAPGVTATPLIRRNNTDITWQRNPSKRVVTPEEVANFAVILCSSLSRMVVGDTIYITGGAGLITQDDADYSF